jgi:branched-chain amino acid transport system permease protein
MAMQEDITTAALAQVSSISEGKSRRFGSVFFLILLAATAALPFAVKNFVVFQLTMVLIYGIAIMGLNLLTGFNGQFSLGHSAFFAVGAYTAAILMNNYDIGYIWTLPAAALTAFIAGILFGLPALRLEPIYLALATYALAVAMPQLLKLTPLEPWTGGVQGITLIKPDPPFGLPLNPDQWLYEFTLGTGLILYFCARNLVNSRTGRALMAIRDNPIAARAMGINLSFYKTMAFGTSALFTGIAGALAAIAVQFVAPDSFTFSLSIGLLVGLVVGGLAWLPGALVGGAFVLFVPNIADSVSKGLSGAVYGVILFVIIYLAPFGAGGLWRTAEELTKKWRK